MATITSSLTLPSEPMAHKRKNWLPLILTSPAILAIIGTMVPFVTAFYYSFTNYSLVKPDHKLVGLANYVKLFTDAPTVTQQTGTRRSGFGTTRITRSRAFSGAAASTAGSATGWAWRTSPIWSMTTRCCWRKWSRR